MKRPILPILVVVGALALSGCGEPTQPAEMAAPETGWVMPPVIDTATVSGREVLVTGHAAPLGRVVVNGGSDLAYAVGADEAGRFQLRVPRPARDTLFTVEALLGQAGYPAPYRLLVGADPNAPIALLAIGAPTRRLDAGSGLDAVDSDGRAALLSGRAEPGSSIVVVGQAERRAVADGQGRWRMAGAGDGSTRITVAGVAYAPVLGGTTPDELERAGAGWRIAWSSPGAGRQSTWFPDRSASPTASATSR